MDYGAICTLVKLNLQRTVNMTAKRNDLGVMSVWRDQFAVLTIVVLSMSSSATSFQISGSSSKQVQSW